MASVTVSSDFRSSIPLAAAWGYTEGSFSNIVRVSPRAFVDALRAALGLPASGIWDDALQTRLIAVVTGLGPSWASVLALLQQDATDRTIRALSLHTGIYLAYYRANGRRFDAIQIVPGTVPPLWGVPVPFSRGTGAIVAYDPSVDTDPQILESAALALAVSHSTTGVRIEPGRPAPGSTTRIVNQESAIPAWAVILLSVVVVGGVILLTKGTGREDARR